MNIRPYAKLLRDMGFLKAWEQRATKYMARVVQFEHLFGNRKVEIQLWEDGEHRASHFLRGRMCTFPTYFKTPAEMLGAIHTECTRTDHPPRNPKKSRASTIAPKP